MNIHKLLAIAVIAPSLFAISGCGGGGSNEHGDNDGHGHEETQAGHQDEGGGDEHGDDVIKLSDAQLRAAGVKIEPLAGGEIATHIMLPAEIGLNQDAVLHVTPRVPGIVTQVNGYLGHEVKAGDLLAKLESTELGEQKIIYLQAIQAKIIAGAEHDRQITISKNTATLLDILREDPAPGVLREQADSLRIGINKGRLLSTYARMKAGAANYAREQELHSKGLSTQADLLASQEMFYSAQAEYMAAFEDIDFSFRVKMQEAMHAMMIATSGVDNAERRLHLL